MYTSVTPASLQIFLNLSYSSANSLSASYTIFLLRWKGILFTWETLFETDACLLGFETKLLNDKLLFWLFILK